jgi:leader peptidase (prepilin peptidase)/N-methyltransferase
VAVPDWIWLVFVFAFGSCVGSFLNVVIYRLPRDKSLIRPPSACPACGRHIRFYDNIPLVSWVLLGRKCRYCKARISPRYFIIEMVTGVIFSGLFFLYFRTDLRPGLPPFWQGGWFVYVLHIILLASLVAASAIDLELWVIPISVCWFATAVGLVGSAVGGYVINPDLIRQYAILPAASVGTASLAAGAATGLGITWVLVASGLIKRSYESGDSPDVPDQTGESPAIQFNHREETCKEIVFLLPIIICSLGAYLIIQQSPPIRAWLVELLQRPVAAGLLGSIWGYFAGCGVVWGTRILGTLGFGKEAMGLGDVHLMGAAGATIGATPVIVTFFVAPFFGLAWAGFQMFFKKTRQIPYGPFLSLGIFVVMILHDRILGYLSAIFYG